MSEIREYVPGNLAAKTFPDSPPRGQPAAAPPPPNASRPAPSGGGVTCMIGPRNADLQGPENKWFRKYCTLPLTPPELPVAIAGLWQDNTVIGGQRSSFGGAELDNVSFSGQLEPPAAYVVSSPQRGLYGAQSEAEITAGGGVVPRDTGAPAWLVSQGIAGPDAGLPGGVVLQPGGSINAQTQYLDPWVFNTCLAEACKEGEVVRLVIGDEYGYNSLVTIRSYTYKWADPDADVINFTITFKSWEEVTPLAASSTAPAKGANANAWTVKVGETLYDIATKTHVKTSQIINLNRQTLSTLWNYHDTRYHNEVTAGPDQGQYMAAGTSASQSGSQSISSWDVHRRLRNGFSLRLR